MRWAPKQVPLRLRLCSNEFVTISTLQTSAVTFGGRNSRRLQMHLSVQPPRNTIILRLAEWQND
ncbi:MAG: hypothetical protein ACTS6G_00025 [Candidatus Hodgkinia cicadicola]